MMDTDPPAGLREAEIRPDHLMKEQADRFAADVRWLLQSKSRFVHVPCPACGEDRSQPTFEKYDLSYLTCMKCGTMYISPRPPGDIIEEYYTRSENYGYWNNYIFPASEPARRAKIFAPRARRVAEICGRYGIRGGTLLEVGAGFGTFCEEIQKLNLFAQIIAVEPTPGLAETCRQRGLKVIEKPIEKVQLDGQSVDVVASFEVLEHLFSPRDFLQTCRDILSPGGLLVLTCPNGKGFDVSTLGPLSNTVDAEHLNYFHPASLRLLIERCGFEMLEVLTPGELDAELVRAKIRSGEFDVSSQPFLKQVLVEDWERLGGPFQQFLANNLLSSHMWAIARKPPNTVLSESGDEQPGHPASV